MLLRWSLLLLLLAPPAGAAPAVVQLRPELLPWTAPRSSSAALGAVAADTLRYLDTATDPLVDAEPLSVAGRKDTLAFIARITTEDHASGADRLADPAFLAACFTTWRWVPGGARPDDQIRLTRYLAFSVDGSATPSATYSRPLLSLPDDEAGLSPADATARAATLLRYRYTKQQVLSGVYASGGAAAGHAAPLVWITDAALEQALLQGTIAVNVPGEPAPRLYNVDRNNGIAYDRAQPDTRQQRRYWYFRAADTVRGWGVDPAAHIALVPEVAVAGDLDHLGLGRILALRSADGLRLVVLADTGGAFQPNLHQLDLYTGIFPSRAAFDHATSAIGDTAAAWVVVHRADTAGCH